VADTLTAGRQIPPELIFEFDMYEDPDMRKDLHRGYARLRGLAPPIFWTPLNGGHWMVTSFDTISAVVMDTEHFSNKQSQIPPVANPPSFIPLSLDPPENMPYRKLLTPYFSPKAVKAMDERIAFHANRIVDSVKEKGHCEFLDEISAPFPVTVFMIMMGLPLDRFDYLRGLVDDFFNSQGTERLESISVTITGYLQGLIDDRRADPKEDLISFLVHTEMDGRKLTPDELIRMVFILLLGGLDTVTNVLTFTIHRLAEEPEIQDRLIADPSLIPNLVEEGLRLFGPVNAPRVVKKDLDVGSAQFRVGDMVLCMLPLGGWDDAKNADPTKFDLDRKERKYLTFSTGAHLCLGHFLARSELKHLFSAWMAKIGKFRLAEQPPLHYRGGTVMALESLQLEWTP
jgi:cytochrome P450